jgi:predicted dehydrogenase
METVGVGLVGAGFVARLHLDAWRRVVGVPVEVRAVAAAHVERAQAFAAELAVAVAHASAEELLEDPTLTVVDLCVPNHLHAPLALVALRAGKHVVVEKPLTGCFADPATAAPAAMLDQALAAADAMLHAAREHDRKLCYAENWVYAPPVQKARRLLAAAGGTILRLQGEESHSGTHSEPNKRWVTAGGGSLLGKGCHPLGAAIYLKGAEGRARDGRPIRPVAVTAETASLTRVASFVAEEPKYLRTGYVDVEDWGSMLVTFADGTVAEITAADATLGGLRNRLTIFGSNAVIEANLSPNTAVRAYAPAPDVFAGEYLVEKLETKAGWSYPSPDEDWIHGYPQELQDFAEAVALGREPEAGGELGREVLAVTYAAYQSAAEGRRVAIG